MQVEQHIRLLHQRQQGPRAFQFRRPPRAAQRFLGPDEVQILVKVKIFIEIFVFSVHYVGLVVG
jgi:hypothetical protein